MRKNIRKSTLVAALSALALLVTLGSGCITVQPPAPAPAPAQPSSPQGNRPPTITSFTNTGTQTFVGGTIQLQAVADDPDNDKINYSWSATGGTFQGGGAITTWQSPKQAGSYEITIKVDDGKGGTAQKSMTLTVVSNQNPVISKLTANPAGILPGSNSLLTCEATDPEGDSLTYNWSANEGTITGTGNKVTWFAPNKGGTFNITVLVKDGKGGESTSSVAVTISLSVKTTTINFIKEESGTVASDGGGDKTMFRIGDDERNVGYRTFWSFNVFNLNRTEIKDAKLILTVRSTSGNPFVKTGSESLGGLMLWRVTYGDRLPQFNITGQQLQRAGAAFWELPTIVDVTPDVDFAVKSALNRFQIEGLFNKSTNGNGIAEWVDWTDVKLEVTYSEIP